ncbi:hypothetical protein Sste5346_001516 [Sporothrix stenoceras]|uniref:TauD/TfdA-like domain-containing protein n=1 Tax=Sporothrix stenoceras TaxID=5173 RepID=A0ABR3ZPN8_9PEZI
MQVPSTTVYPNTWPPQLKDGLRTPPSYKEGGLTIQPILQSGDSSFGAEIQGVDWSRPVSGEVVQQLISLQDKFAVLVFRDTGLDDERHIAFTQQLGRDLEINPFFYGRENDRVGNPYLWDVSNINIDGTTVQPGSRRWHHSRGNALWHTDSSFHRPRAKYSLLLSHGAPARGGSWTHFADTRRAYNDLADERKAELDDLVIEHDLWHSRRLGAPDAFNNVEQPSITARHRLVQEAPDGRKTLYIAAHAKSVVGWDQTESEKLICDLIDHCTAPEYVFSLEWLGGGDLVWWDNRQCMHRANPYTTGMTARDVRRATVNDDGPLAYGVVPKGEAEGDE